jgi:hypothetical protein
MTDVDAPMTAEFDTVAEPEPGACHAAVRLFRAPVVQADAMALPWPDASAGRSAAGKPLPDG